MDRNNEDMRSGMTATDGMAGAKYDLIISSRSKADSIFSEWIQR